MNSIDQWNWRRGTSLWHEIVMEWKMVWIPKSRLVVCMGTAQHIHNRFANRQRFTFFLKQTWEKHGYIPRPPESLSLSLSKLFKGKISCRLYYKANLLSYNPWKQSNDCEQWDSDDRTVGFTNSPSPQKSINPNKENWWSATRDELGDTKAFFIYFLARIF